MRNVNIFFVVKPEVMKPSQEEGWYWKLKYILGRNDMDWIFLVQDRDQWLAVVNTVMNLGFRKLWVVS
jgi:hypothetical protein